MTDTPPSRDDDLLAAAAPAPEARQHRSHRRHRRSRSLRPLDIAGIVVAVLVVVGVVVVIAKGHSSSSSATATSVTTATSKPAGGATTTTIAGTGAGPNATVWTFTTLTGTPVKVTKTATGSARFTVYKGNSVPLAVAAVDKALAKNDCAAVQKLYTTDATPDPKGSVNSNNRHNAYAHYALVQATAKGCAWAKATPAPPTSA